MRLQHVRNGMMSFIPYTIGEKTLAAVIRSGAFSCDGKL